MTGERGGTPGPDARAPEPAAAAFKERRTPLGRLVYREDLSDDDDEPPEEEDREEAIRIARAVAAAEVAAIQANVERRIVEAAVEAEVTGAEKVTAEAAAEAEEAAIEAEVIEVLKNVEARHRMPAMVQRPCPVRPSPNDITQFNLRPPTGGERVTFHCMTGWHAPAKK